MNDPIILRAKVREVLALNPRRTLSEAMLKTSIERLLGGAMTVPEFQAALEWNHSRAMVEFKWDEDAEANFWRITKKGIAKEAGK
jgi:hypothetical protein